MDTINDMEKKMKVQNLAGYLMYGAETDVDETEDYEQELKESYEFFFKNLEERYPGVDRQDDELFRLVMDFAMRHESISFKAGMFIGFQIYKNLEEGYQEHEEGSIAILESFIKKQPREKKHSKSLATE